MTGVNDRYDHMCEKAAAIRLGFDERGMPSQHGGDRFFMQGMWHYPPDLYRHLITCKECEQRTKEHVKAMFDVSATVPITTLLQICQKYDIQSMSTSGSDVFQFICKELREAVANKSV